MANQWPASGPLEITITPPVDYRTYGQAQPVDYRAYAAAHDPYMPRETYQRDPMNPYAPPEGGEVYWTPEQGQTTTDRVAGAVAQMPIGMAGAAWDAFTAPGRAYQEGMTQDEMIQRSADLAGMLGLGGAGWAKAAGGANELGIFGGRLAKTADHAALARAEKMAAEGVDPTTIWNDTGWFQGADKKWRFEIPDDASRAIDIYSDPNLTDRVVKASINAEGNNLPTAIGMDEVLHHPDLYRAYGDIPEGGVLFDNLAKDGARGGYLRKQDQIFLDDGMVALDPKLTRSVALHEGQHAVQSREGFARGGSPKDPALTPYAESIKQQLSNDYDQLIGEMQAYQDAALGQLGITRDNPQLRRIF